MIPLSVFGVLYFSISEWGMNSYLYAPKDDEKHRAYWRDLYTLDEAAELSHLIKETTKCGIHFIYAISPGLDMTFSNKQEVVLLKKKLDQVREVWIMLYRIYHIMWIN